jgi:hypothetical protein
MGKKRKHFTYKSENMLKNNYQARKTPKTNEQKISS